MKRLSVKTKYSRWTTTDKEQRKFNKRYIYCICDCGNKKYVCLYSLEKKLSLSCGCLHKEQLADSKIGKKHGMTKTHFYIKWDGMVQRCNNEKHISYKYYGGKGIKVCSNWLVFENFYKEMFVSYNLHLKQFGKKNTTIERIDNNKNYSLENTKWATILEQNRNKTNIN